ncbi:MAG: DUF2723 domain-containing protein [Myxococcota bacterium]
MAEPLPPPTVDDDEHTPRAPGAWRGDLTLLLVMTGLYTLTATTTLQGADNPEWVSMLALGGTAHPPGYPLYSLLLRAWGLLGWGNPSHAAALLSSLLMAVAVLLLARAVEERAGHVFTARLAAVCFGLTLPVWRMAGVAEVSPLLAVNAAALLWAVSHVENEPELRPWHGALIGALLGMGVAHHHSLVFLIPVVIGHVVVVFSPAGARAWALALGAGLLAGTAVLVGSWLLFLSLPSASQAYHFTQLQTLSDVVAHVLRREYGTFSSSNLAGEWSLEPTRALLADTITGLHLLFPLALIALRARRGWPAFIAWLLAGPWLLGTYTVVEGGVQNPAPLDMRERFHVLPLMLMTLLAGDALAAAAHQIPARKTAAFARSLGGLVVFAVVAGGLMTLPQASWRGETALEHTLRTAVRTAPKDAVAILGGDPWPFGWQLVAWQEGRDDVVNLDWPRSLVGRRLDARSRELLTRVCPPPCVPPALGRSFRALAAERPVVVFPARLFDAVLPGEPLAVEGLFARLQPDPPPLRAQQEALEAFQGRMGVPGPLTSARRHAEGHAIACWAMPWLLLHGAAVRAGDDEVARAAEARAGAVLSRLRTEAAAPAPAVR